MRSVRCHQPAMPAKIRRDKEPARRCNGGRARAARCRLAALLVATPLLLVLPGCKSLLPTGVSRAPLPWGSYAEAFHAIDRIIPYETTRTDLHTQQIDPAANPSITILSYTDLLQRLAAVSAVDPARLERGIADCLNAGKRCSAYSIEIHQSDSRRVGNFWLDMLNFRRDEVTTGWSFSALIIFIDDLAVYALAGGQPNVNTEKIDRNPLGPLQGIGQTLRPSVP
jgi:hypothetical protein